MRLSLLFLLFITITFSSLSQQETFGSVNGICISRNGTVLTNVKIKSSIDSTRSSAEGMFSLKIPSNSSEEISFIYQGVQLNKKYKLGPNTVKSIGKIKLPIQEERTVIINRERNESEGINKLPSLDLQKIPTGNVERALIFTTAASSNNELTANYNVRGGSYDENLVYVNGFLINRPFLTRSGQQEGLSFLYSSLVQDIRFSGGGFENRYGDKLSSVLDITYLTPDSLNASLSSSLLGVEAHIAHAPSSKINYLAGARYRSNGYFLNSLPTKGAYNPVFYDGQFLVNVKLASNLTWSTIGHFSSNNYRFQPQTQETDFGTVNEAYRLKIYFDGQEQTVFQTLTAGTALKWSPTPKLKLDVYGSIFQTNEQENFDVLGQYYINLLEKNPGSSKFGDSIATVGVGGFLNHARNELNATILNVYHNGSYQFNEKNRLLWGINYQKDHFTDALSEWRFIDSAGFSLSNKKTYSPNLEISDVLKGDLQLSTQRISGFLQHGIEWGSVRKNYPLKLKYKTIDSLRHKTVHYHYDTLSTSYNRFLFQIGTRFGYTEINKEAYVTPRISFTFFPRAYFYHNGKSLRRNTQLRLATGLYYQPPFYREFRTFEGQLNTNVKSQKSLHTIATYEFNFGVRNRTLPFKFSSEIYYKYMWDVNPYEIDNVRTRYYATNQAEAYAYGIDVNVHGEFVEGVQSFFKVGFLSTKENMLNDYYYDYYNQKKEKIVPGYTDDQMATDSVLVRPGYVPRPTDQLINFAILFQDKMPQFEMLTAQMGLFFGSPLPYGPPDFNRYKDTLRQKSYFRVDLGLSYDILYRKHKQKRHTKLSDAILSFEVFNLMGIDNILSKQWIQDVNGSYYAIPNYLTQRRFNLKLILRI